MTNPRYPFEPNYVVPPGSILEEWLEDIGLSQAEFARRCGRSPKLISQIISGDASVEPETAIQFGRVLGCNPSTWRNLELNYRDRLAKLNELDTNPWAVESLQKVPVKELVDRGLIEKADTFEERVNALLTFFGLGSLYAWNERLAESSAAFRKPEGRLNAEIVETWLRTGELDTNSQTCQEFSKPKFRKALHEIRNLADNPIADEYESIRELCNQAGVAFAIVKPPKGTGLYGAARWLTPHKALIQLSFRGMVDDSAWFSFFHEAAHLLLHSKKQVHLDYRTKGSGRPSCRIWKCEDIEQEANTYAEEMLIAGRKWKRFVLNSDFSARKIKDFARHEGISPGIVVGRLQHEGRVPWNSRLNSLKSRYKWSYEKGAA